MAWKRGNPGDPCCVVEPPGCECPEGGATQVTFQHKPTIRTVISGLPASIDFIIRILSPTFNWNQHEIELTGLDAANGTYFLELPKIGNCIDYSQSSITKNSLTQYSIDYTNKFIPFGGGCSPTSASDNDTTPNFNVQINYPDLDSSAGANGLAGLFGIWSVQNLKCQYDYDATQDPSTQNLGISGVGPTVALMPADQIIYLVRRGNQFAECGVPADGTSIVATPIGTIVSEILDLP